MSGRRTQEEEIVTECYFFGQTESVSVPPGTWWLELTTTAPTDSAAGTAWGAGRAKVRNNATKFWKNRPRTNKSGIFTPKTSTEKVVYGFELWDAQTSGNRRFWGRFLNTSTEDDLTSFTVPAGKGVVFRIDDFRYYED